MQNRALVDKLEEIAAKKGCTAGQLAIAWLLHKSPNVIPLFGSKSPKNIESSIASVHVKLTPEEFETIDSSFAPSKVCWNPDTQVITETQMPESDGTPCMRRKMGDGPSVHVLSRD